jgi:hypothetical protein
MPVPFMQPMTNVVDCIHNATKTKNQDEISFPGGKPEPSVEKFCRKIPRCVRDKGCAPDSRAESFLRPLLFPLPLPGQEAVRDMPGG